MVQNKRMNDITSLNSVDINYAIAIILIAMVCTFFTRVIPFALFGGKKQMPLKLGQIASKLPPAIIAILVIYCIKDTTFQEMHKLIATMISIFSVIILHIWKREILISIAGGTILYMILLRII